MFYYLEQAGIFQSTGGLCGGGRPTALCGAGGRACGQTDGAVH